jgi:hypothetical protein
MRDMKLRQCTYLTLVVYLYLPQTQLTLLLLVCVVTIFCSTRYGLACLT